MLRVLGAAFRAGNARALMNVPTKSTECQILSIFTNSEASTGGFKTQTRLFSPLCKTAPTCNTSSSNFYGTLTRFSDTPNIPSSNFQISQVPARTLTKYSRYKGKRKSVKTVLRRFYRLNWGMWIRTKAGRFKHLWKKTIARKRRLRRHVFTNATQSRLLDIMVCKYWRRPKYYVDDPYNPYHNREEFYITRRKPSPAK